MSRGVRTYEAGAYSTAVELLRQAETERTSMRPRQHARYCLARGLAHLAVGDRWSAERWLAEAKALDDTYPWLLSPAERGRLHTAWRTAGHGLGERGRWVLQRMGLYDRDSRSRATAPDRAPR
jgi:uncharacterized protein HemY